MFKINRQAKCVLDKLTEELNEPGDHREIDKAPGFMSVHIEHIGDCNLGPMFSVAHYFLQNGDIWPITTGRFLVMVSLVIFLLDKFWV